MYAQLLQWPPADGQPGSWRRLHAQEVALLNGVPLDLEWGTNQRLNLCAIGQMAAPMQSIWLAASLARHMQILFSNVTPVDHMEVLNQLKHEVFAQGKALYQGIPRMPNPAEEGGQITVAEPGLPDFVVISHNSSGQGSDLGPQSHQVPLHDVWVSDSQGMLVQHETPLMYVDVF